MPGLTKLGRVIGLLMLALTLDTSVAAQGYPSKPIRFVVPYAPGGNTDILARLLGQKLSEAWGQQVIIDNRPGAAGTVGAELVARAPADGYTLIMGSFGNIIVANSLYKNLKYDPFKDFASIALVSLPPGILVENPAVPAQNVRELIAYAKSNPGRLNYGSPGAGAWNHLFFELFNASAGISIVHVPYKGIAPAVVDLLGGQVQLAISAFPTALPHIRSGKLRALAVTSAKRSGLMTDVPTVAESGLAGYEAAGWFGVLAPAGTPPAVVSKLNAEINRILELPEIKASLASDGAEPAGGTPVQMTESARAASAKWSKLIRELNLRTE
ncbi:MAG TPA: tripartite tricarboxylate transporter substrate binding protein [Burkholderiales bacterium]|nr:tripartite tricarboxylate transporter substrate binding protein [Burkholderiales bacterium]